MFNQMICSINDRFIFPLESDIPAGLAGIVPVVQQECLIDGAMISWNGEYREVFSPVCVGSASGISRKMIGQAPLMTKDDALRAVAAARRAYDDGRGTWPSLPLEARIERIESLARVMECKKDLIAPLLMWEIGKTYLDSVKEFDRTILFIKSAMEALREHCTKPCDAVAEQGIIGTMNRVPVGIVLCMGPFNYPLFETLTAVVPALATGNTVIFKPPRFGSLVFQPLLEAFRDLFPPGAVNVVYGRGAEVIPPILSSGVVNVLAFIGTSRVASYLRRLHPKPHRLRCVLGLEAKNPAIILPDADLDTAVKEGVSGALAYNGQRCAALKIFFVHTSIVDEFLTRFVSVVEGLKCGMPWEEDSFITPLVEPDKPEYLAGIIDDAVSLGARIVNDSGGLSRHTLFSPAVLHPVSPAMRIYREEQFGPVIPVATYEDVTEVLTYMTQSDYGQQASVFGRDPDAVARLADRLIHHVGRVNINCQCQRSPDTIPFTGRKDSAEGSLSVSDIVQVFTVPSLVTMKSDSKNTRILEVLKSGN